MSQTVYTPGVGQAPYGNQNANPEASNYQNDSVGTVVETNLLRKSIHNLIFDAAPKKFDALKIFMDMKVEFVPGDEFEYMESTFGRSPLTATANVAAQAASPGATVTQTVPLSADSLTRIAPNYIIVYPNGAHGVVTAISGSNATVNSLTGKGLPAITFATDVLSVMSSIEADGDDKIRSSSRLDLIKRYNYVQFFFRSQRWGKVELQKFKNLGTTNYLDKNKAEKIKQLRIDIFNAIWNGERGEYVIADGMRAKAMGGIYPTMVAAGSAAPSTNLAGLQATFEATAFATQYGDTGARRFLFGTDKNLYEFSKIYKEEKVRYTPDSKIADLNLEKVVLGTQEYVLVSCELWREQSCFPVDWANRLICLDMDNISRVQMQGIESPMMAETNGRKEGSRENFKDFSVEANCSLKQNNPLGSFIINITA